MKKIYFVLNKISDIVQKPLEFLSAAALFVGAMSLFLQVVNRYILVKVFHFSFSFTEELARYTIIWFTYLIAGVCLKEGCLISLDLVYNRLPRTIKLIVYYFTRVLMMIFVVVITRYVIAYIPTAMKFTSIALKVPGVCLYTFPGIGCVLMGYEIITETCGVICGELEPFCSGRQGKSDNQASS